MRTKRFRTIASGSRVAFAVVSAAACRAEAETAAGSAIVNVAQLSHGGEGHRTIVSSNEIRIVVAERLDVALAAGDATPGPDGSSVVPLSLTNLGNGRETFAVAAAAAPGDGRVVGIAADTNRDGRYDPADDAALAGSRTAPLVPGQAVTLFALVPAAMTGSVTITAAAATGSGTPGDTFPGAGDGGGDAVVGPTGAAAGVTVPLALAAAAAPTLTKTAVVTASDGSAHAVRGAIITYTLVARFPVAAEAARVSDAVPAGTAYVPATLTLDGAPLSDAADADAGTASAAGIAVAFADQPAGATRTVRFRVVIQ